MTTPTQTDICVARNRGENAAKAILAHYRGVPVANPYPPDSRLHSDWQEAYVAVLEREDSP